MRSRYSLVVVAVLGMAMVAPWPGWGEGASLPSNLRESDPVVCDGQSDLVISGRLIRTSGNGVEVKGNCDVEIVDSHIIAEGVGVLVYSNGDAEIRNSVIEGGVAALEAAGNGDIEFEGSTIRGATRARGNADVEDEGGNLIEGRVSVSGHGSVERTGGDDWEGVEADPGEIRVGGVRIGAGGVQVGGVTVGEEGVKVGGAGGVVVDEEGVEVGGGAVTVGAEGVEVGGGAVTVGAEGVEVGGAGGVAVRTGPGGDVVVDVGGAAVTVESRADGSVMIKTPGVAVSGDWRTAANARYGAADTESILIELGATVEGGETRLQLAGDVLFDFDSAAVRSDAASTLAKVAHVLRQRSAGEVHVVGHTDSKGGGAYNQKLSERRAVSVMHWLNANEGIPAHLMVGRGMGSKKPIDYNTLPDGSDNPQGRARNRRVEISFASSS